MKRSLFVILAATAVISIVAGAIYWFGSPRIESFAPADGALDVPASEPLRLTFSRPMQAASVQEHLIIDPAVPGRISSEGSSIVFTPNQPWPSGTDFRVELTSGARADGFLPLPLLGEAAWIFTVRQPHLLYLSPSNSAANLYSLEPGTGQVQPITQLNAGILEFDVNSNGTTVYYSIGNGQGGSDIYTLPLSESSGSNQAILLLDCQQAQCRAPRVSPQEDYLAYERTGPPGSGPSYAQVWYLPLSPGLPDQISAGQAKEPIQAGEPLHQTIQPDWSPNGLLSFYDTNQQAFFIFDPAKGMRTIFPNQTGEPGTWNAAGDVYVAPEIFFNTDVNPDSGAELQSLASSHLMQYHLDDSAVNDLTSSESLEDTSPVFSPDGSRLVFARKYLDLMRWTPGRQMWMMQSNGANARPLTDAADYNHFDFAWSPEEDLLAFVRFDQTAPTNLPEIWILDLATGLQTQWVTGGYAPHWVP